MKTAINKPSSHKRIATRLSATTGSPDISGTIGEFQRLIEKAN